jgi:hypothetical protein
MNSGSLLTQSPIRQKGFDIQFILSQDWGSSSSSSNQSLFEHTSMFLLQDSFISLHSHEDKQAKHQHEEQGVITTSLAIQ